ncbi:hypothetical protein QJS10_CPB21g00896 [Acorus calamus]|uniref:Large ribosomal subunit protein uL6c n=1 Tax=Acorus calamus TaxID=4465 RepID=A0AAV9C4H4_ACOCL|nr:hypothetical protein QJS10_CPB21g00896 [Acorus calamus]
MATPRPIAAFCSAADAVLTPFFLLIAVAAPLIDAQTVLPGCLFPRFLSDLKSWYADTNGDYLMRDHPGFFIGLVWLEIAVQWPLAVANAYAVTAGRRRRRCRWYPTSCLLYGASTASGMDSIIESRSVRSENIIYSHLRSSFLGETSKICVTSYPITKINYLSKTVECKESRIGKKPIEVPSNVTIVLEGQDLKVKGPLGELSLTYPREVKLERDESGILKVSKAVETRKANQMHGLFRTLTDNMVVGVSKGFEKKLQLIGVGYRAMLEGKDLVLNLGFSHPVRMTIPEGVQVKVEDNTRISVTGYDKSSIGQFAASIRKWRPPEPYKGKGVKYADEVVRRKEGKAGKKK